MAGHSGDTHVVEATTAVIPHQQGAEDAERRAVVTPAEEAIGALALDSPDANDRGGILWDMLEGAQAAGDPGNYALDDFCRAVYGDVLQIARRLVRDPHAAEDMAQETFFRFVRALATVTRDADNPRALLFTTLRNLAIDRTKSRNYNTLEMPTEFIDPDPRSISAPHNSPVEERFERETTAREVEGILASLKPEHGEVLRLRFLLGFSNEEVAELLDIEIDAVKARQYRALKTARAMLTEGRKPRRA